VNLNPAEVRAQADRPVRVGLVAASRESLGQMEQFFAPHHLSPERLQVLLGLTRAPGVIEERQADRGRRDDREQEERDDRNLPGCVMANDDDCSRCGERPRLLEDPHDGGLPRIEPLQACSEIAGHARGGLRLVSALPLSLRSENEPYPEEDLNDIHGSAAATVLGTMSPADLVADAEDDDQRDAPADQKAAAFTFARVVAKTRMKTTIVAGDRLARSPSSTIVMIKLVGGQCPPAGRSARFRSQGSGRSATSCVDGAGNGMPPALAELAP